MITLEGTLLTLVFSVSYVGQSISSGMDGRKAKWLQWACWLLATGGMLVCYLLAPDTPG